MQTKLEKGDIVSVSFNNARFTLCHEAELIYRPCATGDSWIFRELITDTLHYVSEGCTVTLVRPRAKG